MEITPDIEITDDGSHTLVHPIHRQTYHSTRGAVGESMHVFIENGLKAIPKLHVRVLEVGFGSGLNAWLTLDHARRNGLTAEYHAIELYPVSMQAAERLGYTDDPLFTRLHAAPWDASTEITPGFVLSKFRMDLCEAELFAIFDLVYFDAFAPDCQPALWERRIFDMIYGNMEPGGILVTYSSKGSVKQALRGAGFAVARMPGALGKRHMIRAMKPAATL